LVQQARDRYKKITGKTAGLIGEGVVQDNSKFVAVSYGTAYSRRDDNYVRRILHSAAGAVFDEVHGISAQTCFDVSMMVKNAFWRLGLSATPFGRSDNTDFNVVAATGNIIHKRTIADLAGTVLAVPLAVFYKYHCTPGDGLDAKKWPQVYKTHITESEQRNKAVLRICSIARKPIILFYHQLKHGNRLQYMLDSRGYNTDIVNGYADVEYRTRCAKQLSEGAIDILLASSVFNKGIDIPGVRSCINAAGYKSSILALQRLGRGTRKVEGKDFMHFWDIYDREHPTLESHALERIGVYTHSRISTRVFPTLKGAATWLRRRESGLSTLSLKKR
jgi:superfamily II DNA or RNA helicase